METSGIEVGTGITSMSVFFMSMQMVMGPTPPGTGVMREATYSDSHGVARCDGHYGCGEDNNDDSGDDHGGGYSGSSSDDMIVMWEATGASIYWSG